MFRQQKPTLVTPDFEAPIKAICFMNPFWQFWLSKVAATMKKVERTKRKWSKNYDDSYCVEMTLPHRKIPPHMYHWYYDLENRIHRRVYHGRTMLTFCDEVENI
jgi:hypothetical protein